MNLLSLDWIPGFFKTLQLDFMGQILNWLITVVEGVAAAPFLAFAHLDTDGEGLGQKTHYGYTFMLQSFMRPVMLVLGFMFSCILLETIGGYVMGIYPTVMANAQMDSMTGLFSIFGFTSLFFVIMVGLINTCMTVMYLLPDAIFAFIGAHASATAQVGRHEAEKMEKASYGGIAVTRVGAQAINKGNVTNKMEDLARRRKEEEDKRKGIPSIGSGVFQANE